MDLNKKLDAFIDQALQEDIGDGDHTSLACIPKEKRDTARLLVKEPGVIAGVEVAKRIFEKVDPSSKFEILMEDGSDVHVGDIVYQVECNTQALLKAERLSLNIMQRMSGIATLSNRFMFEVEDLPIQLLDTRKTTPLIRFLEKWAVRLGGCYNYRDGLYDRFMVKDNHVDACGGIDKAIKSILNYRKENNLDLPITVEVRNLVELHQVLETGNIDRIMLDNFELALMTEAVETIDKRFEVEASGGMNIHTVREVAKTGVDFISIGGLTHSATSLDMSLKVVK
jgi:nicotinate-nucleotide pyrophosphorylase (carboxylating)